MFYQIKSKKEIQAKTSGNFKLFNIDCSRMSKKPVQLSALNNWDLERGQIHKRLDHDDTIDD